MIDLFGIFAGFAILAAILSNIAIWAPRRLRVKLGALATTAIFLPTAYFGLSEMLGRPKPVEMEWTQRNLSEAQVIGSRMEEGKAIYLWLGIDGMAEPRAYALPWSQELARQLHGAESNAKQSGTEVRMRSPFEASLDERQRMFYAAPPPPPPLKDTPEQNPLQFQRSENPPAGGAE